MKPWEKSIRNVVPYVPGEQPKGERIVKLNTNENPYPPAPGVMKALRELPAEALRRYPDPSSNLLVEALADRYRLEKNRIFVGVGSDDVLGMAFLTFFNSGKPVLFPEVTYSFYPVWAGLFGIPCEALPLGEGFRIRPEDYRRDNGGVVIANPNAPTGVFLPLKEVEEIVKANEDVVVIVDEAYIDFGGESARALLERYENLLVVQTFSKSRSLAGMRIGFAMGSQTLIEALTRVKYSYNSYTMNQASILLGAEALKDEAYFKSRVEEIVRTRQAAKTEFERLGFSCTDSSANFLFVTHKEVPALRLFEALRREQIYVRYFGGQPQLKDSLRVTIGTQEEMRQLFACLASYLKTE